MTTENERPLGLGLGEGLGPLPEPTDVAPFNHMRIYAFTGAQMRAYAAEQVAAERERCAKLVEAEHVGSSLTADDLVPGDEAYNMALQHAAAAIRGA